ncbi:MAG: proline--tRNA ligase [Candidatus Eremiobacteraeota bacterium]|nr:proline--tRNA ligase [Candidatus Eremiobacteraeota bacterium]MBV8203413.1 proline--tRNA ligase [Candidatus Eremiobacteraeota bacterium]MBV8264256.1 proline--tRNA ligase [Candidatus Eremiobacteraeota bacterium]MBV8340329.1 proline--tRNA ligase [Candidatus Eremiobacteraeota bacterium]MBV8461534.1 proline--tRNA ligase [Candidatus Eremiobacteraeota bacterium]
MKEAAKKEVQRIPPKAADLSEWYTQVCLQAQLADYAPVRGCIVMRPYAYAIWELITAEFDRRFKATGHQNAYFPLLIPESLLVREAEHVEGFAPEVAWVTEGGGERLTERLAIRPTSEAVIGMMYAKWIQSHRDLPVLINQWANVMRWEKATRPFLRTLEFLWQEGHTAHATREEAAAEVQQMLEIYREVAEDVLALPVISGRKSENEKFAGALSTYAIEALMPDGKALQAGTSHELGQNFARAYDITFTDVDEQTKHVWTTSWGVSWRILGGLIMAHGDDNGLVLPPAIAPHQVVVVPIPRKGADDVLPAARALADELRGSARVHLDDRAEQTAPWKFNEWELRGVPVRVELGKRDVDAQVVTIARRDTLSRETVPRAEAGARITALLAEIQAGLLARARADRDARTIVARDHASFLAALRAQQGFVVAPWCEDAACELEIKAQTGAVTRVIKGGAESGASCAFCGKPAKVTAYFARSY